MDKSRAEAMQADRRGQGRQRPSRPRSVAKADKAIAAKIDKADAKIAEARAAALAEIESVAAELTQDMVGTRRRPATVDADAATAAVAKELANG